MKPRRALVCAAALALAACVPAPAPQRPAGEGPHIDLAWYETAPDGSVYEIDPARSTLEIRTGRAGALMHLGHNHVITSTGVNGLVFIGGDRSRSRADLWVDVNSFVLDEPSARAAAGAGFESVPSAEDIAGTWANLMGPSVLDSARYPRISARLTPLDVPPGKASLTATFTVRGTSHPVPVSAQWRIDGRELTVSSHFDVAQTDLGITPFSALAGALRVADDLHVAVALIAYTR